MSSNPETSRTVLYVGGAHDPAAQAALAILNIGAQAQVLEVGEDWRLVDDVQDGEVIPLFGYDGAVGKFGSDSKRFPGRTIRIIDLNKEDPLEREVPVPEAARELASKAGIAVAIKPGASQEALMEALRDLHRARTGERLPGRSVQRTAAGRTGKQPYMGR